MIIDSLLNDNEVIKFNLKKKVPGNLAKNVETQMEKRKREKDKTEENNIMSVLHSRDFC